MQRLLFATLGCCAGELSGQTHSLHLFWNITEFSRVRTWAVSEPQAGYVPHQLIEAKGTRKLWPPWSGPLNSPEQVKEAQKLELEVCSHAQREAVALDRVVLQLSGLRQSLKFLCWIQIGSSGDTFLLVTYPWLCYFCIIFELQLLINKLVYNAESKSPFTAELLLCHSFVRQLSSFFFNQFGLTFCFPTIIYELYLMNGLCKIV